MDNQEQRFVDDIVSGVDAMRDMLHKLSRELEEAQERVASLERELEDTQGDLDRALDRIAELEGQR